MAIVFVSPRRRQTIFFASVAVFFTLFVIVVALIVFFAKPKKVSEQVAFKRPNIQINLSVLDSNELKVLLPLDPIQYNFIYQATQKDGKSASGKILAVDQADATAKLSAQNLIVNKIEQESPGRENPFGIYYQQQTTTQNLKKK